MSDGKLGIWKLRFTVEVAASYHDRRRTTLGGYTRWIRGLTLVGALISIIAVLLTSEKAVFWVGIPGGIIAAISIFDLVFRFDESARKHDDLYRRCKELQAKIALSNEAQSAELELEAQLIWKDEPPIYWALYAMCWNQIADKYANQDYEKKVGFVRCLLSNYVQFAPQDFRPAPN